MGQTTPGCLKCAQGCGDPGGPQPASVSPLNANLSVPWPFLTLALPGKLLSVLLQWSLCPGHWAVLTLPEIMSCRRNECSSLNTHSGHPSHILALGVGKGRGQGASQGAGPRNLYLTISQAQETEAEGLPTSCPHSASIFFVTGSNSLLCISHLLPT